MIEITRDLQDGSLKVCKSETMIKHFKDVLFESWIFDNELEAIKKWNDLSNKRAAQVRREKFGGLDKIHRLFGGPK